MKNIKYSLVIVLALLMGCSNNSNENEMDTLETENLINLSEDEISDVLFLREEEKLARDVYLYAYDLYKLSIFNNIAKSEQSHMDNVLTLIDNYGLEDPIFEERGKFKNIELQELYNTLIKQCNLSLLDAFLVGNTIEDLDIYDIIKNESRTSKTDILDVYSSLKCGSKNHLRSFYKQVTQSNGDYNPVYISSEEFNLIVSSSNEFCGSN
ncbi:DUF2202 domain-containing protein [Lutibacter citreus]|uniref:DUF2202 domain-containing protein n=1 Tax=Lutibacter citreus TaxID=2138210 RepID=UPI000DBE30CB|nr:DUF2202 domain-containing protein [Lutibacter citreus]